MSVEGNIPDREDLDCPVCHELLYEPIVPPCGHPVCKSCLTKLLHHSRDKGGGTGAKCPVCRRVLHTTRADGLVVCRQLDVLLAKTLPDEYAQRRDEMLATAAPMDEEPTAKCERLPIFVLDSLLPRQRMHLNVFEPRYRIMVQRAIESGSRHFGMTGSVAAVCGVEVQIVSAHEQSDYGRFNVEIVGHRPFRISSSWHAAEGYLEADVTYFDFDEGGDENDVAEARSAASDLPELVETWTAAILDGGWQRHPYHLAKIREQIGPMPPVSEPGKLSAWVVALVNPIPGLGVAPEMRPALLEALCPRDRVAVAQDCLRGSMKHLSEVKNRWTYKAWRLIPPRLRRYVPAVAVVSFAFSASPIYSFVTTTGGQGIAALMTGVQAVNMTVAQ